MKRWPTKPLAEVVTCLDSQRIPVKEDDRQRRPGSVPYYGANGQVGWIDKPIFDEPLLLVAEDGGHFNEPERGVAYTVRGPSWINNHAHALRPDESKVLLDFLGYHFRHFDFRPYITGTTRAKLTQRDLMRVEVPVPALADQERLVKLLDDADELRKWRLDADSRTAALVPALFDEMFGDSSTNPKRWRKENLGEVCDLVNGAPFKPSDWDGSGLPIVRIQNLNDSKKSFNYTSKQLPEKFRVRPGDILLSWSGTPGTSFGCFNWNGPEGWLNQHIFNVKLKAEFDGEFFIQSVNVRLGELIAKAHGGVGLQHVTKGTLNAVEMLVPPIALQKEFAARVTEIRVVQSEQATSRTRLNDLFQSMLHRAFNGEL